MTDIIYTLVHVSAIAIVFALWRQAPDGVQRGFLVLAAVAMVLYLFGDLLAIYGIDNKRGGKEFLGVDALWQVSSIAGAFAHTAILAYLVRQWWIKTRMCDELKGRVL